VDSVALMSVLSGASGVILFITVPFLLVALAVGFLSGLFQAGTSIQDQSIGTVPRLVACGLLALILGPWILRTLADFARSLLSDFSGVVG